MSSLRSSSFLLTLRLRSRRCWTSWRLRVATRRLVRVQRRTLALGLALDSSLLLEKELAQLVQQQEHRLQEMADSLSFRQGTPPPPQPLLLSPEPEPLPPSPPELVTHLDRLLLPPQE